MVNRSTNQKHDYDTHPESVQLEGSVDAVIEELASLSKTFAIFAGLEIHVDSLNAGRK